MVGLALAGSSCEKHEAPVVAARAPSPASPAISPAPPSAGDDGQWTMPARNHASTRFSDQDQINAGNVSSLRLAWTFSTGVLKGHEAAPLVVGDTMYLVTPYPNVVYALDLSRPRGPVRWVYKPKPAAAAQGVACCDVVSRGAAYDGGRLFFNTLDDHTIAL